MDLRFCEMGLEILKWPWMLILLCETKKRLGLRCRQMGQILLDGCHQGSGCLESVLDQAIHLAWMRGRCVGGQPARQTSDS